MGWQDTRAAARGVVHATFGIPATYYAPGSAVGVPVRVRHHTAMWTGGDLDREGYAEQVEDVNRIVLDSTEVSADYKGKVVLGNGDVLYLEVAERQDAGRYQVWNVLRQRYVAPPPPAPAPAPP
jgi:hypothetical protein